MPWATWFGGTDATTGSAAQGLAVETISGTTYVYAGGWTYSATFPTTAGVYQPAHAGTTGNYNGWIAQFNPSAVTGPASLIYSTYLGTANSQVFGLAADPAGNTYAASAATTSTFPVTNGAFRYTGYSTFNGGAYVTKLNGAGTALVYSAYLGFGTPYGIAVEQSGAPSAYITGLVGTADWPTTNGAYQTNYAGGFAVKLHSDGASEDYSTFLGGPSSFTGTNVTGWGIAIPNGCLSSCNAFISGWTSSSDFPAINALQNFNPAPGGFMAFLTELSSNGTSALLSTYLSGFAQGVWDGSSSAALYGFTPGLAVDSASNVYLTGNLGNSVFDFPTTTTIPGNTNTSAFLAKIGASSSPYLLPNPGTINFGSQTVGVSTATYEASSPYPGTLRLRNLSGVPATISSIVVSPGSIFTESDDCAGTVSAGGYCTLTLYFTPAAPGLRTGTVTINSNASNSPTVVNVSGSGIDGVLLQVTPNPVPAFGGQQVGTTSPATTLTLTNLGDMSVQTLIYMNSTGAAAGTNFTELNNCPSQLAPGISCTISLTFTPTQVGLLNDTLVIGNGGTMPVSGTGVPPGGGGTIAFAASTLDFGTESVGSTTNNETAVIQNTGSTPVTIQALIVSGDFALFSTSCTVPGQLNPQSSCNVNMTFTPTAAGTRTGNLAVTDTATGSPQQVSLTGVGLPAVQTLNFYPATGVAFPDEPVGVQTNIVTVFVQNAGTAPVAIDRVLVSGDFQITASTCQTTLNGTIEDGTGSYASCSVNVAFTPTTTGFRSGALTFIDSASNSPQTVTLSGSGIADTGTATTNPAQLNFGTQINGTTSAAQAVFVRNPGNSPVTVNSYSTGASDFAVTNLSCPPTPFVMNPFGGCQVQVTITPTASGARTGTLTLNTSAGNPGVALTGTGVTATQAIAFTPPSPLNSGSVVVGQQSGINGNDDGVNADMISIRNTGTKAVTFSANPAVTGANAADFHLNNSRSCGVSGAQLQPNASCAMWVNFQPSGTGAETATLTFTDDAGTQSITLQGTGIAAAPNFYLSNNLLTYDNQPLGTTSTTNTFIRFYNNTGSNVSLGNIALTGDFLIPANNQNCSGVTLTSGTSCFSYVSFAATAAGHRTGTITFQTSGNTPLATANLDGFAPDDPSALLNPSAGTFPQIQVVGTTTAPQVSMVVTNSGDIPLTIGTITGSNLGAAPTSEFALVSNCSTHTLQPGQACTNTFTFTPNAPGARSTTLTVPITYSDGTITNLSGSLAGTGAAEKDSAVISPTAGSFVDQTVGITTGYSVTLTLTNSGNLSFTLGTVTGTNLGAPPANEFSDLGAQGGSDGCSGQTISVGGSCQVNVRFTPSATGTRTGNVQFPVTFADGSTIVTATLSGKGVANAKTLRVTPLSTQFQVQIVGTTSAQQAITVTNLGNSSVSFGTDTVSSGFVIGPSGDGCTGLASLAVNNSCTIYVAFAPASSGNITGTLTIADNGGGHTVQLSGVGIPANQQIALSQSALAFGNQPAGSSSTAQVVFVTNQGDTGVSISMALGGTNAADYQFANVNCPSTLAARATCYMTVAFTPQVGASGLRSAQVTVTTSVAGETSLPITLTGTAVATGPAATLSPPLITFSTQNVGSASVAKSFSVTNTGSASLTVSNVSLGGANAGDYAITGDGCSGGTFNPNQACTVSLKFSPLLGGTRSATVSVTDNAAGSPHSISVSGTGFGVPVPSLSTAALNFANTNIGVQTAAQNITLTNTGSDVLSIASITITGVHAGDYNISANTCGATLAASVGSPHPSCTISVRFQPTASGSRGAAVTITDNANNAAGSTQNVALNGTGVAVPSAALSGGACAAGSTASNCIVSFATTNIGTASSAQTVTLTNAGSGPLTITTIAGGGTNSGDFGQTNNCGATLLNGTSCTVSVTFTPTAAGSRSATITITDNAGNTAGSIQTITLSGTGQAVPNATTATPGTLTFTDQNVNTTSVPLSFALNNGGTGALTISSVTITGANAADFTRVTGASNCGSSLAANSSCSIYITFTPSAPGSRTALVTVTDNANNTAGSTQTVTLNGNGIGIPNATGLPASLSFGNQNLATTSSGQSVTLNNTGTGTLTISRIGFGGTDPGDYAVSNTTCGATLAVGANCSITVTFSPLKAGSRPATLVVSDNSGNTAASQTVNLTGTGVAVPIASPSGGLTFSGQAVNTSSTSQNVTLTNTGTGTLVISSIAFSGGNAGDFSKTTTCGSSLVVGASCTVSVIFTPKGTGSRSANLVFTDNSGGVSGSTQPVALSGSGLAAVAPTVGGLSPNNGTGTSATLQAQYTDADGVSDLFSVRILISPVASVVNACYAYYAPRSNMLSLTNDAGTALTSAALGSATMLSNSQCALSASATTVSTSGNTLTVNWAFTNFTFSPGAKTVYLYAVGMTGLSSGQVSSGTFTIPGGGPPTIVSLSPTSGSGLSVTFQATYGDPDGLGDLHLVYLMVNSSTGGANACWVYYYPPTNSLYLRNDGGTAFLGPVTLGTTGAKLTNSQCTLDAGASSVATSGNQLTLNAALTFSATFTGQKNVYMSVTGFSGSTVPFTLEGTWTP
ncbi:MAG TPA: choice-of-anchor D domain-containing protein [Bryobacteraceae bacterium]|nr:choice-of-anchor D domain-containing protein [Bryobacteraceae bacterium]